MPGPADPTKQISDPCPQRLTDAQNVRIWTASVVIGTEPMPAQADWALIYAGVDHARVRGSYDPGMARD